MPEEYAYQLARTSTKINIKEWEGANVRSIRNTIFFASIYMNQEEQKIANQQPLEM